MDRKNCSTKDPWLAIHTILYSILRTPSTSCCQHIIVLQFCTRFLSLIRSCETARSRPFSPVGSPQPSFHSLTCFGQCPRNMNCLLYTFARGDTSKLISYTMSLLSPLTALPATQAPRSHTLRTDLSSNSARSRFAVVHIAVGLQSSCPHLQMTLCPRASGQVLRYRTLHPSLPVHDPAHSSGNVQQDRYDQEQASPVATGEVVVPVAEQSNRRSLVAPQRRSQRETHSPTGFAPARRGRGCSY
jgi:hypothetical protein